VRRQDLRFRIGSLAARSLRFDDDRTGVHQLADLLAQTPEPPAQASAALASSHRVIVNGEKSGDVRDAARLVGRKYVTAARKYVT
jgi:hypothetical protein